jgi:hypothetical protein
MAAAPVRIPETDEAVTGVQVLPPSVERARMFVAPVLLPATQTPLEYPMELQTGKGAFAEGALDATTDHAPAVVGADDIEKTFVPPPLVALPLATIQSGAPAPCAPARPYATHGVSPATAPGNGVNMG